MPEYENVPGRIYDIQGYAVHDGPGIRTTVYTKGCPLRCLWCHSPESQPYDWELGFLPVKCLGTALCEDSCILACPRGALSRDEPAAAPNGSGMLQKAKLDRSLCDGCLRCTEECMSKALYRTGWDTTVDEVYARLMKDKDFFSRGGGVTVSGGEAMSQFAFTLNLCKRLKAAGIHICLDTTGFAPKAQYAQILPYIDLFLYDLKHMNSEKHRAFTGVPNELILENARFLAANGGALQIRVPVIPKFNASGENLRQTAEFCASLGDGVKLVQLLPYHQMGRMKYERVGKRYRLTNVEPPAESRMEELLTIFRQLGLPCQIH